MENNKRRSGWLLAAVGNLSVMVLAACQTSKTEPTSTVIPTIAFNQDAAKPRLLPANRALAQTGVTAPVPPPPFMRCKARRPPRLAYSTWRRALAAVRLPRRARSSRSTISPACRMVPNWSILIHIGEPISTVWGANRLLPGWEEGVGMMKPGGKAKLVLPADLAFGEQGYGAVPPNSQIVMEVELLSVEPAPVPTEVACRSTDQDCQRPAVLRYRHGRRGGSHQEQHRFHQLTPSG